jgi:polyphosphate glucokinase
MTHAEYPKIAPARAHLTGHVLGIDIGGTGIKAAVIDLASGKLVSDRIRELTPRPATAGAVVDVVTDVVGQLEATGLLVAGDRAGACFPSVMRGGTSMTAVHGVQSWVGVSVQRLLEDRLGRPMVVINDADAAGVAEIAYGAGKGQSGVVLFFDLGTGIGSALFVNGQLVPNMQLGHIAFQGQDAERRLSPVARRQRKLSWKAWGVDFNALLARYEEYFWPDLIIVGGGAAKDFSKYAPAFKTRASLVVAALGTNAGIVGAARVGGYVDRPSGRRGRSPR